MTEQTPLAALAAADGRTRYYELTASTVEDRIRIDRESFDAVCKLHRQAIRNASAGVNRAREWIRYADFLLGFRSGAERESRLLREQAARALEAGVACYRSAGKRFDPIARMHEERAGELRSQC